MVFNIYQVFSHVLFYCFPYLCNNFSLVYKMHMERVTWGNPRKVCLIANLHV